MRVLERRAYAWQIREGRFRKFQDKSIIAVLMPEVRITSVRKQKIRKKTKRENGEITSREYLAESIYKRGEVLCPIFRKANDAEKEDLKSWTREELKQKGVISRNGEFLLPVIMKIKGGLPAAARQKIRHIPGSLIQRKGRGFTVAGDAGVLTVHAKRLNKIIESLLEMRVPVNDLQTLHFSERNRSRLIKLAEEEIDLAREGKFWERALHSGAALVAVLEERARKYEMAVNSLILGIKLRELYEKTCRKFRSAYERMGTLIMSLEEAEEKNQRNKKEVITKELYGIYLYLTNTEGSCFDPFSERVNAPEFQALGKVLSWIKGDEWKKIIRSSKAAQAKIEAIAKGEIPSLGEIKKIKENFYLRE